MHRLLYIPVLALALTALPALAQESVPPTPPEGGYGNNQPPMMPPGGTGNFMPYGNFNNFGPNQPPPNGNSFGNRPSPGNFSEPQSQGEMMEDSDQDERMNKQRLQQAKQMIRGIENMVKQNKKKIDSLTTKKVNVPAEYTELINELTTAVSTIKTATEWSDEVEAAQDALSEKGEEMREIAPALGMLEQWPRITKRATDEITKLKKQVARIKAKKLAGTESAIESIETKITQAESALSEAKSSTGNFQDAMESLQDNVFGLFEDIRDDFMILENISNLSKISKEVERELTKLDRESKRLAAKKKDVTHLNELIAKMRTGYAEMKSLLSSGTTDREEVFEAFSELESLRNDALEELAHLNGQKSTIEKEIEVSSASTPIGAFLLSAWYAIL